MAVKKENKKTVKKSDKTAKSQDKSRKARTAYILKSTGERKKNATYTYFPVEVEQENNVSSQIHRKSKKSSAKKGRAQDGSAKRGLFSSSESTSQTFAEREQEEERKSQNKKKTAQFSSYQMAKEKAKEQYAASSLSGQNSSHSPVGNESRDYLIKEQQKSSYRMAVEENRARYAEKAAEKAYQQGYSDKAPENTYKQGHSPVGNDNKREVTELQRERAARLQEKLAAELAAVTLAEQIAEETRREEARNALIEEMKRQQFKSEVNDEQNEKAAEEALDELNKHEQQLLDAHELDDNDDSDTDLKKRLFAEKEYSGKKRDKYKRYRKNNDKNKSAGNSSGIGIDAEKKDPTTADKYKFLLAQRLGVEIDKSNRKKKYEKQFGQSEKGDSLLYKSVSAAKEVVNAVGRIEQAGARGTDIGDAAGNMLIEPAVMAGEKAAHKVGEAVANVTNEIGLGAVNKMVGMGALVANAYKNADDAGDKMIAAATAIPNKVITDKVKDMAEKTFLGKASGRKPKHLTESQKRKLKHNARIKTPQSGDLAKLAAVRAEKRREQIKQYEAIRKARIEYYKQHNGMTGSLLERSFKKNGTGKRIPTELAESGSKILLMLLPVLLVMFIVILICCLFFWLAKTSPEDKRKESQILWDYVQYIDDYFYKKQLLILESCDRHWGGFEPDMYTYYSIYKIDKPFKKVRFENFHIEEMDKFGNRWLKLKGFSYEDIIALAAVKKFHELETKRYYLYDPTAEVDMEDYVLQIDKEDLDDILPILTTIEFRRSKSGHCDADCTEYFRVSIDSSYEVTTYNDYGEPDGTETWYVMGCRYSYGCAGRHTQGTTLLEGCVIDNTAAGEDLILKRVIPVPSRTEYDSDEEYESACKMAENERAIYYAYKEYIRDTLKTETRMPDFSSPEERMKLLSMAPEDVQKNNPTADYVCELNRESAPPKSEDFTYETLDPSESFTVSFPYLADYTIDDKVNRLLLKYRPKRGHHPEEESSETGTGGGTSETGSGSETEPTGDETEPTGGETEPTGDDST